MKKIVLIMIATGLMTMSGYSQEDVLRPKGRTDGGYSKSDNHPWAVGLEGGLSYNMYGADLNWTDELGRPTTANSIYNIFESLSGISPHFGVFVDYDLNKMFGIHLKLLYNAISYGNDQDGIVDFRDSQTGVYLGTGIANMELTEKYSFFNIEPNLRINATDDLYFLLGPSFQFGMGTQTSDIIYTENEDFVTYNPELPDAGQSSKAESSSADFSDTRVALNLGAGYKFKVGNNLYLAPQLIYNLGLTTYDDVTIGNINQQATEGIKFLTVSNQSVNQLRFSITLWFENL
ncbi:MAG: outer membrane beta-barrel protein [Candidatus Kapaibacterium sp.]